MTAVISCRPVRLRAAGDGCHQLSSGQAESHAAGDGCHQLSSGQAGESCHLVRLRAMRVTAVISCRPVRLRAAGDGCHQLSSGQAESHG